MADTGAWPYVTSSSSDVAWPPYPQIVDGAWPNWPPPNGNNNFYGWPGFGWSNGDKSGLGAGTIILIAVLVTGFSLLSLLILRLWFCGCGQDDDARSRRRVVDATGGSERKMAMGLSKDVIESFQVVSFKALAGRMESERESESLGCPVCLIDFGEEDKRIRVLPVCGHSFHSDCIDMWLFSHTSCPVCRRELPQALPCSFNIQLNNVIDTAPSAPGAPTGHDQGDQVVIQIPQEEFGSVAR